jgi:hypothetical protein
MQALSWMDEKSVHCGVRTSLLVVTVIPARVWPRDVFLLDVVIDEFFFR